MRRLFAIIPMLIAAFCLSGCTGALHVEEQAYIIAMGLERTSEDALELSVRIPQFNGAKGDSGGETQPGGGALSLSVKADSYESAMEELERKLPRSITLTQLELIALSGELACSPECADMLDRLVNTAQLNPSASVVVCQQSAKDFIDALQPEMSALLSSEISASIEHYRRSGVLPECSLANLYSLTHSVFGNPTAAYAVPESKSDDPENKNEPGIRFGGSAVFKDGFCRLILDDSETVLVSLICDSLESFGYICDGELLEFSPIGDCHREIRLDRSPAEIELSLRLSVASKERLPGDDRMEEALKRDMLAVIDKARRSGVDPFGFAQTAAPQFLTLQQWREFDWQSCFEDAEIYVNLRFSHADA